MSQIQDYRKSRLGQTITPLSELLPLETPLSLLIDPSNVCNFKCVFCPTGDDELLSIAERPKGMMTLELFQKIIDDLQAFPQPVKVIHLYKDGEPLANKSLGEMIAYAKASGQVQRVETTTNGSLLNEKRAQMLIDSGLDGIRVSVYATDDDGYQSVTQTNTPFERVRSNVENLFRMKNEQNSSLHVHCKIVDADLSDQQKKIFIDTFSEIADSVHIDSIMGWSNTLDRDMTLGIVTEKGMTGTALSEARSVCSEPFMKLVINFNGEASVCCVDWSHDTVVGHANEQSIFDIWNSEKLRAFRIAHLTGNKDTLSACKDCQYMLGLPEYSNLDSAASELLPIYGQ